LTYEGRFKLVAILILAALVVFLAAACNRGDSVDAGTPLLYSATQPALEDSLSEQGQPAASVAYVDEPQLPAMEPPERPIEVPEDVPEELAIIWEAWAFLGNDYVDPSRLDPETFSEEAIKGMLQVLGDPQTSYISPEVLVADFQDVFQGEFEGIGAYVDMNAAGKVVIIAPIAGSPAELAGIKAGDIVLDVNGESIEGWSLLEAVAKIRGPKGTIVRLLIKHIGVPEPVEIAVQRGLIPLESVLLRSEPGDRFAHIRITNFYPETAKQLADTINQALEDGAEGLILDLRGNPGGPLDSTVDVASLFLDEGLVLYYKNGKGDRKDWGVRDTERIPDIPMVVLVNGGSASSSEVLAGALQDYNRATLIGTDTFGKGSVNILRPLSNGGGLYITIAHWYTPLGRLIQSEGLAPDIEVIEANARDTDVAQLRRALEELENMTGDEVSGDTG